MDNYKEMAEPPTPIINNPSVLKVVNPLDREYTNDKTYAGYVVDIAVLQEDINTITKPDDVYIVNLTPVYLSYGGFQAMFYRNDDKFQPTKGLGSLVSSIPLVSNKFRQIDIYSPECNQCDLDLDGSFNLIKVLLTAYQKDLGFNTECWDTCSLMEFYSIVDKIKALTDIAGECDSGIKCSISLDEFFAQLEMQGLAMDNDTGLPLDPSGSVPKSVYPGLVTAVITANFHSTTPGVNDVMIRWPFVMNFASFTDTDASNNTIGGEATTISGGTYPVYYYIENIPTAYRSPDLSFATVELVGDTLLARDASVNLVLPDYTRYNAKNYSKIFYEK